MYKGRSVGNSLYFCCVFQRWWAFINPALLPKFEPGIPTEPAPKPCPDPDFPGKWRERWTRENPSRSGGGEQVICTFLSMTVIVCIHDVPPNKPCYNLRNWLLGCLFHYVCPSESSACILFNSLDLWGMIRMKWYHYNPIHAFFDMLMILCSALFAEPLKSEI